MKNKALDEARKAVKGTPEYKDWKDYSYKEKLDLYMKAIKSYWRLSGTKAADEACTALDEAWDAYLEADKAAKETPEWKAVEKARKAVEKAEEAYRKTPECQAQNEAYNAYRKAHEKSKDEVDKIFKAMPTKFMGEEMF